MKNRLLFLFALPLATPALGWANDGGVYSVEPQGAAYQASSPGELTFKFQGEYARELKKLLPPETWVFETDAFRKNFRGLIMVDAQGNRLQLACSSAKVVEKKSGDPAIKELPETTCQVTIAKKPGPNEGGDVDGQKIPVQEALLKARQANSLK